MKKSVRCTDGGEQINRTGVLTDTVNLILNGTFEKRFNTVLIQCYDVFSKTTT